MCRSRRILFTALLFCFWSFSSSGQDPIILGAGNADGMTITTSSSNGSTTGEQTVNGDGLLANLEATSRFLAQATLGSDYETIVAVSGMSFNEWIDQQFNIPITQSVQQITQDVTTMAVDSLFSMGGDPNDVQPRRSYWHTAWWQYTMTSPDVLRNRVALALSEIMVISEVGQLEDEPLALANYYDMLLQHSFGNFRDLLEDVTFHPAMGVYLTAMNNPKTDSIYNRFPDENYAREILQLFSIGIYELNQDGSKKLNQSGNPIPTYNTTDIIELAKIFTGLSWGDNFTFGQDPISEFSYLYDMKMYNAWHEPGPKYLLNGFVVPDRTPVDGVADVRDALDNIFNHDNVGPFISRLLIQRMIKSNPTPAYISRVAGAFNNNGSGVRGDMKAVIKAILLDPEARTCAFGDDPYAGMLREPITRYTQVCRAFNAYVEDGLYRTDMDEFYDHTFQRPLAAPTVFNFFQPDFQPIGAISDADKVAPEFQLTNSVTIMGYANELHDWIYDDTQVLEYYDIFPGEDNWDSKRTQLDLSDEMVLGTDDKLNELIERLNLLLVSGQMSEETRQIIYNAAVQLPEEDDEIRVKLVLFLTLISPDYLILR